MGQLIFISGGVRSGKSAFAEHLIAKIVEKQRAVPYYIATSEAFDDEMNARIQRHQEDRQSKQVQWQTIEMPLHITDRIENSNAALLFECVTTWLSNVLYYTEPLHENARMKEISKHLMSFKKQILKWQTQHSVVVVSNEVLDEMPSPYQEVQLYKRLLGELHQWLVQKSDEAYEIQSTIVQRWK